METAFFIYLILACGVLLVGLLIIGWISIEIYFLSFKLEKHPVLINLIETKLNAICEKEGIRVYNKTYDELNVGVENEMEKALGKYCYTLNAEYQNLINEFIESCNKLKMYGDIDSDDDIEKRILPKILLCKSRFGLSSYYSIWLHELGHHFAVKEMQDKHSEKDADRQAYQIAVKELPLFFQLIHDFNFDYSLNDTELPFIKKIVALSQYVLYLVKIKLKIKTF